MTHSTVFFLGIVSGLLLTGIVMTIKKKTYGKCEFDERQELARGKAYKCGFFALIFFSLLYSCLSDFTNFQIGSQTASTFIILCVGVGFFAVHSIWHDAYFSLREQPRRYVLLFFGLVILNSIGAYGNLTDSDPSSAGIGYISLSCSILCFVVLVTIGLKVLYDRKNMELE